MVISEVGYVLVSDSAALDAIGIGWLGMFLMVIVMGVLTFRKKEL
jgi:hypothetical protein